MAHRYRHHQPRPKPGFTSYFRGPFRWFMIAWHLVFAVNAHYLSYQQRRQWRLRGWLFILVGSVFGFCFGVAVALNVPKLSWYRHFQYFGDSSPISTSAPAWADSRG